MAATKKWSDVYPDEAADEIWGRPKEPDTAVIRRFRFAFEVDDGGEAQVAGHAHLSHRGAGRMTRISDFAGTNRTNRAIMASDVHAAV